MEVKAGYKQTEVGVIPEDWEVRLLRDVVDFANGKPHEGNVESDGRYWLITLDSIGIDGRLKAEHKRTDVLDSSLKTNDIVSVLSDLAHGNLLGLCDLIPADHTYVLNQRMGRLRLKVFAAPQFVRLQINRRQEHFRKRGQGTSQKHVYRRDFESLPIPFPAPAEQEAIAEALSDADALVESLEQLLAKKRQLKQGTMQELLTGKKRLPGFERTPGYKQTEVGLIPEDWEVAKLAAVCSMKSGEGITSASIGQFFEYPCYGGNGLRGFTTRFTHDGRYALIGRQGALCGNVLGVEGKLFASEHAIVVTASARTDIRWLTFVLGEMRLNQYSESSAQPGLSVSKLLSLDVGHPPTRGEQEAIAAILSDMDAEVAALEAQLAKASRMKRGMMQELLTGRIRLV